MRMSRLFESTRLLYYALALLLMGHALQASGYDKTIEAVYKPEPKNLCHRHAWGRPLRRAAYALPWSPGREFTHCV